MSTCHWCHVMERETFEDYDAAQILNENFIAIKVDREERPDIDSIYMNICQNMTGSGGWPLSIFMTPEGKAFHAGTYYPKNDRYGMPGFLSLAQKISQIWQMDREKLLHISKEVHETLHSAQTGGGKQLSSSVLKDAFKYFYKSFDEKYGGFGFAPKFPSPHNLTFLLRYHKVYKNDMALEIVEKTLENMYRGGIFDHIGYGFSRYSTDNRWLVPHFEKMLYDNALLTIAYTEAYQVTGNRLYEDVARKIMSYILREMTSEEGGFYSAEDADSEGVEGKFYVWTKGEIIAILGSDKAERLCEILNITEDGNFEGYSIPNLIDTKVDFEDAFLEECRLKLFDAREERVHPYKDDKILTSWNGLMIAAFAKAGKAFDEKIYVETAKKAYHFINKKLIDESGRLYGRYRDGERAHKAYIDDYAFLSWGLLELFEATFKSEYLEQAIYLADEMIRLFWDNENHGFYFYGNDAEELVTRPKESYDGAMPSGNSVGAHVLQRLHKITGEDKWQQYLEQLLMFFTGNVESMSPGHTYMLSVFLGELKETNSSEVVLIDYSGADHMKQIVKKINRSFRPYDRIIYMDDKNMDLSRLVPRYAEYQSLESKPTAYICKNKACLPPVTDIQQLREIETFM